jgi:hypothetical protein
MSEGEYPGMQDEPAERFLSGTVFGIADHRVTIGHTRKRKP